MPKRPKVSSPSISSTETPKLKPLDRSLAKTSTNPASALKIPAPDHTIPADVNLASKNSGKMRPLSIQEMTAMQRKLQREADPKLPWARDEFIPMDAPMAPMSAGSVKPLTIQDIPQEARKLKPVVASKGEKQPFSLRRTSSVKPKE